MQAFPGAYGWGAESIGGRGGKVIHVTNLNDDGTGSFKEAVRGSKPRIVVFDVAGVIKFPTGSSISIAKPYLTIAGQTAPGSGIFLEGGKGLIVHTHNVIIRYLSWFGTGDNKDVGFFRVRPDVNGVHDIIVDHCSGHWSRDDLMSIHHNEPTISEPIYNITVQNCLFGNFNPSHPTTDVLLGSNGGQGKMHHVSIHNNLFSTSGHRNPQVSGSSHVEVINNLVYNFRNRVGDFSLGVNEVTDLEVDYVNNYLHRGPMSGGRFIRFDYGSRSKNPDRDDPMASAYLSGNIAPVPTKGGFLKTPILDPDEDNWPLVTYQGNDSDPVNRVHQRTTRLSLPPIPVPEFPATVARQRVLEDAGNNARLNADGSLRFRRSSEDQARIDEARDLTGPSEDPPYPGTLPTTDAGSAYADADGDGMADVWEAVEGFDPNDPAEGPVIGPSGYSNVELFLNGTEGGQIMPVLDDLILVEAALRQEALDITAQADAVAQAIVDLRVVDDALDAAADVIEVD